ncbi:MAG: AzlC family ABC transporter permease [Propionibacteriaceae bacterium]|jgi:4-azaleucine resistance transporter AzlC|nr:AzlC family ABC transporter permease [Propionibacteriaceae bacterium]
MRLLPLLRLAFPHTVPVLAGYVPMGAAFGVLLVTSGFSPWWAPLMGILIYAGSGQFVAVGLLAAGFDPLGIFLITLMVNARHVFYALTNLSLFAGFGRYRPYLIFALTDETYALFNLVGENASLNDATVPRAGLPAGVAPAKSPQFLTAIAALDQCYWVCGCAIGGFAGTLINFDVTGIDFVMTALFVVILLQQIEKPANRRPAAIGLLVSLLVVTACRLWFDTSYFILTAMAALLVVFTTLYLARKDVSPGTQLPSSSTECRGGIGGESPTVKPGRSPKDVSPGTQLPSSSTEGRGSSSRRAQERTWSEQSGCERSERQDGAGGES